MAANPSYLLGREEGRGGEEEGEGEGKGEGEEGSRRGGGGGEKRGREEGEREEREQTVSIFFPHWAQMCSTSFCVFSLKKEK